MPGMAWRLLRAEIDVQNDEDDDERLYSLAGTTIGLGSWKRTSVTGRESGARPISFAYLICPQFTKKRKKEKRKKEGKKKKVDIISVEERRDKRYTDHEGGNGR